MGSKLLLLTALMLSSAASAQPADDGPARMAAEREALKAFDWMGGEWRGQAVTQSPSGEHRVVHTERSGPLLDGTVRVIEGHSYKADGSTGFNAFAMISYDPGTRKYLMTSHAEGRYGKFDIVPTADGYTWAIPAGPVTIRYTAHFKDGTWTEIGERITQSGPAQPFFRMDLKRIGPSHWPGAGAVKAR